jgi:putative transposase
MTASLKSEGYEVSRKRICRLMSEMGVQAIYPRKKLSYGNPDHRIYPYLLRGVKIERVNQVWATDITYIPMRRGFLYLVAIMDWYSRYVLSWELSQTLEKYFCMSALERAFSHGQPEIFNSDQGPQFTSPSFLQPLLDRGIAISMDGRGRVFDNIFIERLWRTVKHEEVYLKEY